MSETSPTNIKLWEQVKKDVLAESPTGADGAWTQAKEDKAIERYVEFGGQYERAEPPQKIAEAPPIACDPEQPSSESAGILSAQTASIQDFMADVEAASET